MTTTLTTATDDPRAHAERRPSSGASDLVRSARADLSRLVRWPAAWITLGAWLVLSVLFGYLFPYLSYLNGGGIGPEDGAAPLADVLPAAVPSALIQGTPLFGGALMVVLGALVAGSGYGWGTWKTVLTQGPSRTSALVGSLLALLALVTGLMVVSLLLDLGIAYAIAGVESGSAALPAASDLGQAFGTGLLVMGMWALTGFFLGTVSRSPALSTGLGLVWALAIENLLRGVGALLGAVETLTHFLPGTAAGSLVGAVTGADAGTPGVVDTLSGERALWTLAAYVVVFPLVSLLLVRRRDVS
ncbi:ABC transporter permease [Solicola sp. PLA-1-18]|uniref:ABC transporter permease n=1 Tax=Solicola sp. PLA-1-18 TaxID=3380532 RepID=UPI003B7ABAF4